MRKILRYIIRFFLTLLIISILLPLSLYIPFVQDFIVDKTTSILKDKTGYDITVGKIRLEWPLGLRIENVSAIDSTGNKIAELEQFRTKVHLGSILKKKVYVYPLSLTGVTADLSGVITGMDFKASLQSFNINRASIDLSSNRISINTVNLDNTLVNLIIKETNAKKDTTPSSPVNWSFDVKSININNSGFAMKTLQNYFFMDCFIENLGLENGLVDLSTETYSVNDIYLKNSRYKMDLNQEPALINSFDYNHFDLNGINLSLKDAYYRDPVIKGNIQSGSMIAGRDFAIKDLRGLAYIDSLVYSVSGFRLTTTNSNITADAKIDNSFFTKDAAGNLKIGLNADLSDKDVIYFVSPYAADITEYYPAEPLILNINVDGSKDLLAVKSAEIELEKAFRISLDGSIKNVMDIDKASGDLLLEGKLIDLEFVPLLIPDKEVRKMINIPHNINIAGNVGARSGVYSAQLDLSQRKEFLKIDADYTLKDQSYKVGLITDSLHLSDFLPTLGINEMSVDLKAAGRGFDPFDRTTFADIDLKVNKFEYDSLSFGDLSVVAKLSDSKYDISLASVDSTALLTLSAEGLLKKNKITANVVSDIENVSLGRFGLGDFSEELSSKFMVDFSTDLKNDYNVNLDMNELVFINGNRRNNLGEIILTADINSDSIKVLAKSGDLKLDMTVDAGINALTKDLTSFMPLIVSQVNKFSFDIVQIQKSLPEFDIQLDMARNNLVSKLLNTQSIEFDHLSFLLANDSKGIESEAAITDFRKDSIVINNGLFSAAQFNNSLDYTVQADMLKANPAQTLCSTVNGNIGPNDMTLDFMAKNGNGMPVFDVGASLHYIKDTLSLSFTNLKPVIVARNWEINKGNYISFVEHSKIFADFSLTGELGMKIDVKSVEGHRYENSNAINLNISDINLGLLSKEFPDLPSIAGLINVNAGFEIIPGTIEGDGKIEINEFVFDKQRLGNIDFNADFKTQEKWGNQVSATMLVDSVAIMSATFFENGLQANSLSSKIDLIRFPLNLANPFIPDQMAKVEGTLSGSLTATGSLSKPDINGSLDFDTAAVVVTYANAKYKLDERAINIKNNVLTFNRYAIYAFNNNPLLINGNVNFVDFTNITTNLRITGEGVELVNAKKQRNQMIYGRVQVDVNTTVSGPVNFLKIRGDLNMLNGTNVTYVMIDTPVSAQNRVANLVTFTNFNDSTYREVKKTHTQLSGIDMLVTLRIGEAVEMGIDLSANGDDRVELKGGGDLVFRITPIGDMELMGRYVLSGGFVRYNLPVLPVAKTFQIRSGSYVEWNGKLMDPYIDITAAERIRTSVTEEGKGGRVVLFDAMIVIKNRLENLDVSFTVEAPEDASIQNQLATMTSEERAKQAMNLIITQTYTGPGTTAKLNSNTAINSFIQKEINQFTGSALKGVDLSFGIDEYDTGDDANKRTDYSFKFSKQLFNDRFRIVIGGKVSSGQTDASQEQSFIDDVSLEYALDKTGSRYIKLFHHSSFESILEGEITETGLGIVLKRKVRKLRQLFIFNERKRKLAIDTQSQIDEQKEAEEASKAESKSETIETKRQNPDNNGSEKQ